MTFIFFGTPTEATIVLDTLKRRGLVPALIVTAPDRPAGRGLETKESPVAIWAKENSIDAYKPESLKNEEAEATIRAVNADVAIVFAYGKIIPQTILDIPTHGMLNIHPSLLPLHRGPAPVEGAILSGDKETGVTIMVLDKDMDHGQILAQETIPLDENATTTTLLPQLVTIGAEKLSAILESYVRGEVEKQEQDHTRATYTKKISKTDGQISLNDEPTLLYTKYRAYDGWPGIYYFDEQDGKQVRIAIKKARLENGAFIIERIVPEGKKEMNFTDYQRGVIKK